MSASDIRSESRRRFVKFLSGSPLLAASGLGTLAADGPTAPPRLSDPILWAPLRTEDLIKSPAEAINVFEFEPVARKTVPPAHFGYMASGIDDEVTLRANREGFLKFQLRPRRRNDVSKVDMSCELFGSRWSTPIVIAPTGGNKFFHPEGELAVARAAKAGSHLQILSTSASTSVEDTTMARGAPIWFQLYASPSWDVARALIKRAEAAGCPVLVGTGGRGAARTAAAPPSMPCPRSSTPCAAASRCWSTAGSGAAPISSRAWPWARTRCASAGPTSGAWAPSASPASSACSSSCASSCRRRCS